MLTKFQNKIPLLDVTNLTFAKASWYLTELSNVVTGQVYHNKGEMNCESTNIIYLVTYMKCLEQYLGSAKKFKSRFRIHTSDVKTKNDRCSTARDFNNKCWSSFLPFFCIFTCPAH